MHIVESFALNSASKIDKPYIYDTYIPLQWNTEKYITFQPFGTWPRGQAKRYSYWEEVMDILRPIFDSNGIHIVQIGSKGEPLIKGTMNMAGKTTINQAAYLIKNSLLHLGLDSFGVHIASGYGKKIVALYSNGLPATCGPYWSDEKDVRLICSVKEGEQPSWSEQENPKTIDRIKAEEIAQSVCELLGLKFNYDFETVYVGQNYAQKKIEIVPTNQVGNWKDFGVDSMILRMDKHFNEAVCASQLEKCPCSLVTDQPIRLDLIKYFSKDITELVFDVKDTQHIEYLKALKSLGVKLYLISHLNESDFNKLKLNYIDVGPIVHLPHNNKETFLKENKDIDFDNLYYKSGATIVRNKAVYGTYSPKEKTPINFTHGTDPRKFDDCSELWKDLDRLLILKKKTS